MRRLVPLALIGLAAAAPVAAAAQMTVTGRQVPTRPDAPSVTVTTSARAAYVAHCAGCHGMDGGGSALGNVPDMRQLGRFLRLDGGREFLIKVPGVMGSGLADREIADVSNWVLATLAPGSVPPGHQPYTEQEVARARAQPLLDVAAARHRLVEQARAQGIEIDTPIQGQ